MDIRITSVKFLVPVEITYTQDGEKAMIKGEIDYAKQTAVFPDHAPADLAFHVFDFLLHGGLPANTFEANDDVYEQANKAQGDYQNAHKQHVGGLDE